MGYPGHGKTYIKADGKKSHLDQRKIGDFAQEQKESTKDHLDYSLPTKAQERLHDRNRVAKEEPTSFESAARYRGQSWAEIQAKKSVKPEVRKAQRDAAI